ncbi:ANTAR domain-containing protein [Antrihabitans stalactiti]|uniref:ANTAR domain-containing protein n=1 Tax=Antrihabitans stalactiti TaxID=2584121 RepID=A0A848KLB5_9NOCA|nr:ANTAR domain-containing protein [Antrihabitans stalactiti]NMN99059.1 ANTAR domain-containing protein [Antrihabitans stalactiti]
MQRYDLHESAVRERSDIDLAEGLLIAVRRCSPDQASDELLDAARRHHLSVPQIAHALVLLAGQPPYSEATSLPTERAAQLEWGQTLSDLRSPSRWSTNRRGARTDRKKCSSGRTGAE